MSEISVDVSVSFSDEKIRNAMTAFLTNLDFEISFKNQYSEETRILDEIGINANQLFANREYSCDIDNLKIKGDGSITFNLNGGTLSGSDFFEGLIELFAKLKPDEFIAVAYNSQVGELSVYAGYGAEMTIYYTAHEGNCDDRLHESWDDGNPIDEVRKLYAQGKLVMPDYTPEFNNRFDITKISGFDLKLLGDDELIGLRVVYYLIVGLISGVSVFIFGWLVLEYFWASIAVGVVIFLLIILVKTWRLVDAQEEYKVKFGKSTSDFDSESKVHSHDA
jgi:hypothetical protein